MYRMILVLISPLEKFCAKVIALMRNGFLSVLTSLEKQGTR